VNMIGFPIYSTGNDKIISQGKHPQTVEMIIQLRNFLWGIKRCKSMVILRNPLYNSALFGLGNIMTAVSPWFHYGFSTCLI